MEKLTAKEKSSFRTNGTPAKKTSSKRLEVLKTYKIYVGGQFPRTESGRYYIARNEKGQQLANVCLSSRKDFRDAVVAARGAFKSWAGRAAFNRGQILYRIAEMMEGRKAQFVEELVQQDATKSQALKEVNTSIDRLVYYAGWCDKYQQLFSTVNPVASSHFNFSVPEPTGVVAAIASQNDSLLGLVSLIAPVIAGGNVCVVLASEIKPLCSITFAEVINSSDVPGGVVNILTGKPVELALQFAAHMDVNAVINTMSDKTINKDIKENGAANVKRILIYDSVNWLSPAGESPYFIMDMQEIKTTWHPIEDIGGVGSKY